MADLNVVALIGRATKDVELNKTQKGDSITTLSLACNRYEGVDYFDVVLYDQKAEYASQYVKKGTQVAINGGLRNRNWKDKDGKTQYRNEVAGYQIQVLTPREGSRPLRQEEVLKDALPNDDDVDDKPIDLSDIPF